jgi:hypothetical protein
MLYSRRKQVRADLEAAKAGRSLWTTKLPDQARAKLIYAVSDLIEGTAQSYEPSFDVLASAHATAVRELGVPSLAGAMPNLGMDVQQAIARAPEDTVLTVLEAILKAARQGADANRGFTNWSDANTAKLLQVRLPVFRQTIATVLREHWLRFDLVNDQFVDVESRELHEHVVVPALTLLGGAKGFELAEKAYMAALRELHEGDPADAITDAATALQEALTAHGLKGNTVSKLINAAIDSGKLAPYDRKIGEWLEADRSNKGDAHNAKATSPEDGWLVVHVVGALLVRLGRPSPKR